VNKRSVKAVQKENSSASPEVNAAKLAVLSSALTTLADAVATFAALLALEGVANAESQEKSASDSIQTQLTAMQKQLDFLTNEAAKK